MGTVIKKFIIFTLVITMLSSCNIKDKSDFNVINKINANGNDYKVVEFGSVDGEKVNWLVIRDEKDYLILLSKDVLDVHLYNDNDLIVEWEDSTLCDYLNTDFVNEYFNDEERAKILFVNDNSNLVITMPSLDNLIDIFGELHYISASFYGNDKIFEPNKNVIAKPLGRAIYNEIDVFDNETFSEIMQKDVDARYDFADGNVAYWVMDEKEGSTEKCYITPTGYVDFAKPNTDYIGFRAMLRVRK